MITWIKSNRLLSIVVLVCAGFFAYYLYDAVRWLPYPYSIDYGEGFVMNYAKLWSDGAWKWDISTPPYLTMVYGVGFPILATPFVKLFGAGLEVGRGISLASSIIVCVLIYLIVNKLTGKKVYALIAALLPATQPVFRDWSFMARVDMTAVMFDVAGVYVAIRFKDSKWFYLAIILFLCAFLVKQNVVIGAISVAVYLLICNRRRLLAFVGLYALGLAAILIPLMIVSGGEYWKHIFLYQNTIQNFNTSLFILLISAFIYPFVALLFLSLLYVKRCLSKKTYTLAAIFFVVAFALDAFMTFRPGAGCQYYFEAMVAGCICSMLVFPAIVNYLKAKHMRFNVVMAATVAVVLFTVCMPLKNSSFPDEQYTNAVKDVQVIMEDTTKPIITEHSAIAMNMGDLYIEPFVFSNLARLGYWDETPYINNLKEQCFDYVLLRDSLAKRVENLKNGTIDGHFTDDALLAIDQNYTLVYQTVNRSWQYSIYLYEANGKLKNDDRQIVRKFVNHTWREEWMWIWSTD